MESTKWNNSVCMIKRDDKYIKRKRQCYQLDLALLPNLGLVNVPPAAVRQLICHNSASIFKIVAVVLACINGPRSALGVVVPQDGPDASIVVKVCVEVLHLPRGNVAVRAIPAVTRAVVLALLEGSLTVVLLLANKAKVLLAVLVDDEEVVAIGLVKVERAIVGAGTLRYGQS
ncbi:hypothetical protein BC830DRAFT_409664 [Chytriomyces sp. MP71]|nr:hypothetical protein BC830DRAFT_409664 [Chytriomyces sp. MP71]